MTIKPGVSVAKLSVHGLLILVVAQSLKPHVRLTSGDDGHHMLGSKHYTGDAVDLGSHEFPPAEKHAFVADLQRSLGADFDVILEHEGTSNEHIHVEYDPVVNT